MRISKYVSALLLLFLITLSASAQTTNLELPEKPFLDVGLEYGIKAGMGGNMGYTDLRVEPGKLSHASLSFLYKDDGIDRWGEHYESVGERQFSEDIVDEGYSFLTASGQVGIKVVKGVHILGIIEYQEALYVQKRYDEFTILGDNGRYYTQFRDSSKGGIGAGAGIKLFYPLSNNVVISPMIQVTMLKGISLSIGVGFSNI